MERVENPQYLRNKKYAQVAKWLTRSVAARVFRRFESCPALIFSFVNIELSVF